MEQFLRIHIFEPLASNSHVDLLFFLVSLLFKLEIFVSLLFRWLRLLARLLVVCDGWQLILLLYFFYFRGLCFAHKNEYHQ